MIASRTLHGWGVGLVFAVALAVRLACVAGGSAAKTNLTGDCLDYHTYAVNWLDYGHYENADGLRASRMPGYPLFLAAIYTIFGRSPLPVQLFQCLIGSATCALIYLIALDWFDERWALAGALIAAAYYDLFSPSAYLLTECLVTFLLTLAFWFWSRKAKSDTALAAAMGLCVSAAYFTRPELGPYLIILAGLTAYFGQGTTRWKSAVAVLAVSAIFIIPWALRNQKILGRAIVTSTAGASNLYQGIPRTIHDRFGGLQDIYLPPERRGPLLDALGEIKSMDAYAHEVKVLYHHCRPTQILRALVFNLIIQYYPFLPEYDPTLIFLLPFWLWGVWLCRKDPRRAPLLALLLYLTAVYSVVAVMQARHRQILSSALVLLALSGFKELHKRTGKIKFNWIVAGWAGFNFALWALAPWARQMALAIRNLI